MTALPIEGYAREYTDPAQLIADIKARRARLNAATATLVAPVKPPPAEKLAAIALAEREAWAKKEADAWAKVRKRYRLFFASVPKRGKSKANEIIAAVAAETGIAVDAIKGEQRVARIARARQLAIWRIAGETELSLSEMGRLFHRDHTTILHAIRVVNDRRGANVRGYGGVTAAKAAGKKWVAA